MFYFLFSNINLIEILKTIENSNIKLNSLYIFLNEFFLLSLIIIAIKNN